MAPDTALADATIHVAENARLNTEEYEAGRTVLRSWPRSIWLAFTAKCNLKCFHCPRGKLYVREEDAPDMARALFDRIEREVLPHLERVVLGGNNLGEQLVYRHFDEFFRRLTDFPLHVEFVTNATVMPQERVELIVEQEPVFLVSTEGVGATYEKVRGRKWEQIEATIKAIDAARKARPGNRTRIALGLTVFADNLDQIEPCIRLKSVGVDIVMVHHLSPHEPSQRLQSLAYHRLAANQTFDRCRALAAELEVELLIPPNFEVGELDYDRATAGRTVAEADGELDFRAYPCDLPWTAASIDESGQVMPCCSSQMVLGDLTKQSFAEIWNGSKYRKLRATVNSPRPLHDCKYCPTRRGNDPESLLRAIEIPADAPLLERVGRRVQRRLRARGYDRLATLGRKVYRRFSV